MEELFNNQTEVSLVAVWNGPDQIGACCTNLWEMYEIWLSQAQLPANLDSFELYIDNVICGNSDSPWTLYAVEPGNAHYFVFDGNGRAEFCNETPPQTTILAEVQIYPAGELLEYPSCVGLVPDGDIRNAAIELPASSIRSRFITNLLRQ